MRKHCADSSHGNDEDRENDEKDSALDHKQKRSRELIIGDLGIAVDYRPRSRWNAPG